MPERAPAASRKASREETPARVAVVIPTLDEEATLARALAALADESVQLIVSDGGSSDRTVEVAHGCGAEVVVGGPGRGPQLNRGAAAAAGDVLLFVHADTVLPSGAPSLVRAAIASGAVGGGFLTRWPSPRPLLRLGGRLTNVRTRLTRCPLGDQAQFCRADVFREMGGFRDWPILEDLDFARRLKRRGRIALLEPPVTSSVRRYEVDGVVRTVVNNWVIWVLYFLGVPPRRLARLYRNVR